MTHFFIIKIKEDGWYYLRRHYGATEKRSEAHIYYLKEIQRDSHLCELLADHKIVLIPVTEPKRSKAHTSWCAFERWSGPCDCSTRTE